MATLATTYKESTVANPPPNATHDSSFAAREAASCVGVLPTDPTATPQKRKRASTWFRRFLVLAQWWDPLKLPDSFVNYPCLWWKAISGNHKSCVLHDGGLAYDLLPPFSRWAVAPLLAPWYPRYHHANVELRTHYLDQAVQQILASQPTKKRIRLVLIGSGYDVRSVRTAVKLEAQGYDELEMVELDLPHVVRAKRELFQKRLVRRRPNLKSIVDRIQMHPVDLNDLPRVQNVLDSIFSNANNNSAAGECYTIFCFEAVLIYLQDNVPEQLFRLLSHVLGQAKASGAVCFADTLFGCPNAQEGQVRQELEKAGWVLQDLILKPGRTRHLGVAFPLNDKQRSKT